MLKVGGHLIQDLLHPVPDTAHSPWDAVIDPLHGDLSGTIPPPLDPELQRSLLHAALGELLSRLEGVRDPASGRRRQRQEQQRRQQWQEEQQEHEEYNKQKNNETGPPTIIRLTVPPPSSPPPPPSVETFREKAEC